MASSAPNTILLEVNDRNGDRPVHEYIADEALTPGELVRFDADDELEPHGTASGAAQKMFVVENPYADPGANAAINTDYALGATARVIFAQAGDVIYAWGKASETFAKGNPVGSDGAGALLVLTVDASLVAGAIVGFADEDKAVGAGGRERLRVRVA